MTTVALPALLRVTNGREYVAVGVAGAVRVFVVVGVLLPVRVLVEDVPVEGRVYVVDVVPVAGRVVVLTVLDSPLPERVMFVVGVIARTVLGTVGDPVRTVPILSVSKPALSPNLSVLLSSG